jgi:hypothetical protein
MLARTSRPSPDGLQFRARDKCTAECEPTNRYTPAVVPSRYEGGSFLDLASFCAGGWTGVTGNL